MKHILHIINSLYDWIRIFRLVKPRLVKLVLTLGFFLPALATGTPIPLAEWSFDDDSLSGGYGSVTDISSNGHNGSSTNVTSQTSSPANTGSPGTCGYAEFDQGYVHVTGLAVDTNSGGKNTVAFWMYWDGSNSVMPIGWHRYNLWFYDGSFGFNTWNSDIYGISSSSLSNGWHHIVAEFTNGTGMVTSNRLWVDGVEQSLTQRRGYPSAYSRSAGSSMRIGAVTNSTSYSFSGYLDEVKVYAGTLSQSEITTVMNESRSCATQSESSCGSDTSIVADNFPNYSFSNSTGSTEWQSDWIEGGESDGVGGGIIRVSSWNCDSGYCLRIGQQYYSGTTYSGKTVTRTVDLNNTSSATLSFKYRTGWSYGSPTVLLQASSDGSNWTTLKTYNFTNTTYYDTSETFDLTPYASSNTQIRFEASANNSRSGFYVDDIEIAIETEESCAITPVAEFRFDEASWDGSNDEVVNTAGLYSTTSTNLPPISFDAAANSSQTLGGSIDFTVQNNTNETLTLKWVNYSGSLIDYGTVSSGGSKNQQTYLGHTWVLTNTNGGVVEFLGSPSDGQVFTINQPTQTNFTHGTAINNTQTSASGRVCAAANFDGVDQYIEVSGISDYLNTTASLSFWIKTSQQGSNNFWQAPGVTGIEETGGSNDIFWGYLFGDETISINKDDGPRLHSTAAISDDSWHHVVLTRDSSTGQLQIYLDGTLNTEKTGATGDVTNGYNSLGRIEKTYGTSADYNYFQGSLDELLIFDSVIDATTVQEIYDNQLAGLGWDGSSRTCPDYGPSYFKISHDNNGIYCTAENVALSAHDSSDTIISNYTGTITLDTQTDYGTWSLVTGDGFLNDETSDDGIATYTFDTNDNGMATFALTYNDGSAIVNIEANGDSASDDDSEGNLVYTPEGFVLTRSDGNQLSAQYSGNAFNVTAKAISSCGTITEYSGDKNVSLTTSYTNPSTGTISATNITSLNFSNGAADFTTRYDDVGQIQLTLTETTTNLSGASNIFTVRPSSFDVTIDGNPAATNSSGAIFKRAGENFQVTVTSKNALGNVTPNFGNEATPETIKLQHLLVAPTDGDEGQLTYSLSKTSNGTYSGTANWSEVGILQLTARIQDEQYLDTGDTSITINHVGRFIPDHFVISNIENGSLANSCGSFSYLGQTLGYHTKPSMIITAKSTAGSTTRNYTKTGFLKLNETGILRVFPLQDAESNVAVSPTAEPGNISVPGDGIIRFDFNNNDSYIYSRADTASPFNAALTVNSTQIEDSDGVSANSSPSWNIKGGNQRYGRLMLESAYGSELESLYVPLNAQYFDGSRFVLNSDDNCSTVVLGNFNESGHQSPLRDSDTSFNSISAATLINGNGSGVLSAPGEGNHGALDVQYVTPSHLQYDWDNNGSNDSTSARVQFGRYRGNDSIIYWREKHQ